MRGGKTRVRWRLLSEEFPGKNSAAHIAENNGKDKEAELTRKRSGRAKHGGERLGKVCWLCRLTRRGPAKHSSIALNVEQGSRVSRDRYLQLIKTQYSWDKKGIHSAGLVVVIVKGPRVQQMWLCCGSQQELIAKIIYYRQLERNCRPSAQNKKQTNNQSKENTKVQSERNREWKVCGFKRLPHTEINREGGTKQWGTKPEAPETPLRVSSLMWVDSVVLFIGDTLS